MLHDAPFVSVDCGARGGLEEPTLLTAFPQTQLIGFEPDATECARLNEHQRGNKSGPRVTFYPVAVGAAREARRFYVTDDPACSSLYPPNPAFFGRFQAGVKAIHIVAEETLETVALDSYLPPVGVDQVHFLKLDVQGAELDVLHGARDFLASSVLGLKVEVSFAPIYQQQPLFSDVDAYLRQFGFVLFDLSRTRYRRAVAPHDLPTRGQLLWGDAIYLRDYGDLRDRHLIESCLQLAVLASAIGAHDYAVEIVNVLADTPLVSSSERAALKREQERYASALAQPHSRAEQVYRWMTSSRLRRFVSNRLFRLGQGLLDVSRRETQQRQSSWTD